MKAWWRRGSVGPAQRFTITATWYPGLRPEIEYEFCRRTLMTEEQYARVVELHPNDVDWHCNEVIGKVTGPVLLRSASMEFAFLWLEENAGMVRSRDSFVFSHFMWRDMQEIKGRGAGQT